MVQMQQSRLWVGCAGREQQAAGCHRIRMGRQHSSGGAPVMPAGGAAERVAARRVAGRAAGRAAATAATAAAAAGLTAAASASAGRTASMCPVAASRCPVCELACKLFHMTSK